MAGDPDNRVYDMIDVHEAYGGGPYLARRGAETDAQKKSRIVQRIQWLRNTRDYADEVEAAHLTTEIARLICIIDLLRVTP